ncbi:MAG TPA: LysM domain-containing protein, partial [Acidiferrobacteraceae bacterium]|nr:LysM domain-containing protein [Acidiferrobacteraceae bacterium]
MKKLILSLALAAACAHPAGADTIRLRHHVPDRYTVVPGDTLWTIAGHFLRDPWQWPEIWNQNQQIHNPHRIYPGDVIVLSYDRLGRPELAVLPTERLGPGRTRRTTEATTEGNVVLPVVALKPAILSQPYAEPVPTIKPDAIAPFLVHMGVVGRTTLAHAGYVLGGTDHRRAMGTLDTFYGRHLGPTLAKSYLIERRGAALRAPGQRAILGYQMVYIGRAHVIHTQSPRMLRVDAARRTVRAGDRLVPAPPATARPYYYPRPPKTQVRGHIIAALQSMRDLGPGTVVALDLGRN